MSLLCAFLHIDDGQTYETTYADYPMNFYASYPLPELHVLTLNTVRLSGAEHQNMGRKFRPSLSPTLFQP
jgi:hypothetical protein